MNVSPKTNVIAAMAVGVGLFWVSPVVRGQQDGAPADVEYVKDVVFGKGGNRDLRLNYLRPRDRADKPLPAVVWIHGGGWRSGNKEDNIHGLVNARFVRRGYFVASIEYRLSREAVFPAQIEDCKCAIRFLRAKAKELNINPDRIGVCGASAGGHLAALLGTTGNARELEGNGGWAGYSSRVQAVCDLFGPTDFLKIKNFPSKLDRALPTAPEAQLIGGRLDDNKEKAMKANPITYVTRDCPPFLILHGDLDDMVPINQSELLYEALKKAGVDATFHTVKGGGHAGPAFGTQEVVDSILNFFDEHLKK